MQPMNFKEFFQKHKIGVTIFVFAVAVRLVLFAVNFHATDNDFIGTIHGGDGYYEISKNLIDGNGYSFDQGPIFTPEPLRPPLWIFTMAFIAKVFGSYVPVFIFEIILGSLIPVLGMYLARRVISPSLATIVGLLLALEPNGVLLSFLNVSEIPFTFLFLVFVVFLFRYVENQTTRNIVWAGLFLGLAILVKPTVQFLLVIIPVVLLIFFRRTKFPNKFQAKHLVYFITVCVLVFSHWVYRNYQDFGAFGLSAQPAYNLYAVLVPTVLSIDNGTNYKDEFKQIDSIINAGGGGITLTNSGFYIKQALGIFAEHKMAFLQSLGISMVTFFTHDGMLTVLDSSKIAIPNFLEKPALVLLFTDPQTLVRHIISYAGSPGLIIFVARLFWIAVAFLFIIGAGIFLRREKFSLIAYLAIGIVIYFALLTTANGFGMNARFRIPVNAFIFTFAIYGFSVLWSVLGRRLFPKYEKTVDYHTDL